MAMKDKFSLSRRSAIKRSVAAAAAFVGLGPALFSAARARADELPKLSEDDQMAQALEYTHEASTSSVRQNADQLCNNCMYYKGTASDEWARCDLFPGKVVHGPGWCNAWTAKG